jgi:Uma2 family endonuclease
MSQLTMATEPSTPLKLSVRATQLTEEQFVRLCQENRDFRFELTAQKELVIMPLTGSETGWRNNEISYFLTAWTKQEGTGLAFGSSAGFTLPNGAIRSPDASWVERERWEALTTSEREKFAPLCPDFVVELHSPFNFLSYRRRCRSTSIMEHALAGLSIRLRSAHTSTDQINLSKCSTILPH